MSVMSWMISYIWNTGEHVNFLACCPINSVTQTSLKVIIVIGEFKYVINILFNVILKSFIESI